MTNFMGFNLVNYLPWHALIGGLLIGSSVVARMLLQGKVLGVSGIAKGLIMQNTKNDLWRWAFVIGLLCGGSLLSLMYPASFGVTRIPMYRAIMAGIMVGLGTSIGNGCTSGHGICGNARFSPRSFVHTLTFMFVGAVVASMFSSASYVSTAQNRPPFKVDTTVQVALQMLLLHVIGYVVIFFLKLANVLSFEELTSSILPSFMDGSLFACGVGVSGMTLPARVAEFLDLSEGNWNPSLMFVMGGALALTIVAYAGLVRSGVLSRPLLDHSYDKLFFSAPLKVDKRLILGAVLFGAGWGFGGFCPGPAIVSLTPLVAPFVTPLLFPALSLVLPFTGGAAVLGMLAQPATLTTVDAILPSVVFCAAMFLSFSYGDTVANILIRDKK